jgi:hypothetical protein
VIDPGDTNAIIEMGSDVACYVGNCSACGLGGGTKLYRRTMGYGFRHADLMIIADDSLDASYSNPGALDLFTIGSKDKEPRSKFVAVHEIMLGAGFDPAEVYSTTAYKCPMPWKNPNEKWRNRGHSSSSKAQMMPCLTRHLGLELEIIQPAVVLCYGAYPAQFISTYFPLAKLPSFLSIRETASMVTPSSWRYDQMLLIRSPKHNPRQETYRNLKGKGVDLDSIRWAFETARDYLRDELDCHRRCAP